MDQSTAYLPESDQEIRSFTLANGTGMRVMLTNYGATITGIWVPDRNGKLANVVLSYSDLAAYRQDPYYIGATIGRYANRIDQGRLPIGQTTFQLTVNEASLMNHLHGGFEGFNRKVWTEAEASQEVVAFSYTSPHLEEGYPGTVTATVSYQLTEQNELVIKYRAQTDQPTIVNLTNHCYFNLSGGSRDICQHRLTVTASDYTPLNDRYLPTGSVLPVDKSPFDLRPGAGLSFIVNASATFNYCLAGSDSPALAAILCDSESGRRLSVSTTAPGLQVYSGEFLAEPFYPFAGVCLEPQHYPDTPNQPTFPSARLNPDDVYQQTTIYQFDTM